jgi:hypothetical protein
MSYAKYPKWIHEKHSIIHYFFLKLATEVSKPEQVSRKQQFVFTHTALYGTTA